jgi:hypothetical protein
MLKINLKRHQAEFFFYFLIRVKDRVIFLGLSQAQKITISKIPVNFFGGEKSRVNPWLIHD